MAEEHEEKEKEHGTKVLAIDKGFGNSLERIKHLNAYFGEENVEKVILSEPSDKSMYERSLNKLFETVLDFEPNIVIASSRGGYYAADLLNCTKNEEIIKYLDKMTVLLLSGMDIQKCCIANRPILLYHPQNDGITNIVQVIR